MQKTFVRNFGPRRVSAQEYLDSLPTLNTPTTADCPTGNCTCGAKVGKSNEATTNEHVDPDSADALPILNLPTWE
jgi:hypothetical protein